MIIRSKVVYEFDIEVLPNVFHYTVKNTETKEYFFFEISERKNDAAKLIDFFWQIKLNQDDLWNKNYTTQQQFDTNIIFCGYNNLHYDNVVINYIIDHKDIVCKISYDRICRKLFWFSNLIINSGENIEQWKKWKYMICFESFDLLTMLYSSKLRTSLKAMQVTMCFPNVQEFDGDFNQYLPINQIDKMIEYNINDVDSTEELLNRCQKDINLRLAIEDEYGVKVLSKDGVNIGMKIITQKYLEKTHQNWWQIKDLRSPCDSIELNKVILPIIHFQTPILQNILEELKQQVVSPGRKGYEKHFVLDGLEYCIGVGGIHSVNKPKIIIPNENQILSDIDVASLYPSMIIEHQFYPPHLGKEFLEVYAGIKVERLAAKHAGNKTKDATLKLALNGLSGNLQNPHNFCYSPFTVMQIRMNGQLMLLMLAEQLINIGCTIIQANTDGLFILRPKDKQVEFEEVCQKWETLTKLVLEEDRFEAMYQYAINDYLAIKEGYSKSKDPNLLKKKGLFIDTITLGKGMNAIIIPEAINKYFADNIPIEETIHNCNNIHKFLIYQKVDRKFKVEYNKQLIQQINRFYISTDGHVLLKCKIDAQGKRSDYERIIADYGVTIYNKILDTTYIPSNINYSYYLSEARKIILELKNSQLTLF